MAVRPPSTRPPSLLPSAADHSDDEPELEGWSVTVGIVGHESLADLVAAALGHHDLAVGGGGEVPTESLDWVVAEGAKALCELVRAGIDAPVLVVESGSGNGTPGGDDEIGEWIDGAIPTVSRAEIGGAVERADAGDLSVISQSSLDITVDGAEVGRAMFDVALVSDQPARICEYSIRTAHERIGSVRADGIVVATPAGSYGYASAAGGPILETGTDVVAVVPIAAFVTDADHWVLDADGVGLGVERDEPVAVVADGEPVESIGHGEKVELALGEPVRLFEWSD